ncbi:PKD domain-containing protein [Desulfonema limicola]|nr:choice-of-anchor U domain-containing protein [Desulfonema limicola]
MIAIRFRHLIFTVSCFFILTYFNAVNAKDIDSTAPVPEFTATFVEDNNPVHITSSNFKIMDSVIPESIIAYITNMYVGDLLNADVSGTSISQSYDQGRLILSGNDTIENYNKVLQSITFETDRQNPYDTARIVDISFTAEDETGSITIPAAKTTINIIPINDPPVIDLDLSSPEQGYKAGFEKDQGLINITSQDIEITDFDNTHLYELTANIVNSQPGDKLQADNAGTLIDVSFTGSVLKLSGRDTIENYIKVTKSIKLSYDTAEIDRIIAITAKDSTRESKIAISLIVKNINKPVVAHTTIFRENGLPLEIAGEKASLEDPANTGFQELKAVMKNPKPGDILAADISGTSISLSYDNGVLLLTGHDTKENYETALKSIRFSNDSQNPDQTMRIIEFSASTGELSSNIATILLAVIAVNDQPENTIPGNQTIQKNTPLFFTGINTISVKDIDALENDIQVSLSVNLGTLGVPESTALSIIGNNSSELILKGSQAKINDALEGLQYNPQADWIGSVMLKIITSDLGNTGIHGPLEHSSSVNIIVTSSSTDESRPSAHAGADQTVDEFTLVNLNGSGSSVSNGSIVKYEWVQTEGPDAVLFESNTQRPFFTAPETDEHGAVLSFRLTITDNNGYQDSDTVNVNVNNKTEIHDPGEINGTYEEGVMVALESPYDENQIISYNWKQISGPEVILLNPKSASPSFISPVIGSESAILVFELTTEDINHVINTSEIRIKINDNGIKGYPENVLTFTGTGGSMGIRVINGNLIFIKPVSPDTISEQQNRPDELIYGLFDIHIQVSEPGKTAKAEIYFQEPAGSSLSWIKYQPGRGWYDYKDNAVFSDDRTMVTLMFTDGGTGDDDGIADQIIKDPSGLGKPYLSPSDQDEDGDSGGGCFINP